MPFAATLIACLGLALILIRVGFWIRAWRRMLEARRRRKRTWGGLCANCGYDLRASKVLCPECGTPIARQDAADPAPAPADHSQVRREMISLLRKELAQETRKGNTAAVADLSAAIAKLEAKDAAGAGRH